MRNFKADLSLVAADTLYHLSTFLLTFQYSFNLPILSFFSTLLPILLLQSFFIINLSSLFPLLFPSFHSHFLHPSTFIFFIISHVFTTTSNSFSSPSSSSPSLSSPPSSSHSPSSSSFSLLFFLFLFLSLFFFSFLFLHSLNLHIPIVF